jgi:hypothetical protein
VFELPSSLKLIEPVPEDLEVIELKEKKASNKGSSPKPKAVLFTTPSFKTLMKGIFHAGYKYRTNMHQVSTLATSSSAGKYQLNVMGSGSGGYTMTNVSILAEWSAINSLFDEFFIHACHLRFIPTNRHSANTTANTGAASAAGQPGFVNTLGIAWAGYQHNQSLPSDSATNVATFLTSSLSKWANSGDPHSFAWRNDEKFMADGPVGDQSTSGSTQSWCNVSASSKYGGQVACCCAEPTGASALIGTLYEAAVMGHLVASFDLSFRVRS